MSYTPEGRVKHQVKRVLAAYEGLYAFFPVQAGYGDKTLDLLVCANGHFLAIETKAPGKWLTPLQRLTASEILASGGTVFLISNEEGIAALQRWLRQRCRLRSGAAPAASK